jgi:hypothetical protein
MEIVGKDAIDGWIPVGGLGSDCDDSNPLRSRGQSWTTFESRVLEHRMTLPNSDCTGRADTRGRKAASARTRAPPLLRYRQADRCPG